MRARPLFLAGAALLALMLCAATCRAAYRGGDPLRKNAALMRAGDYRGAMLGLLDIVLRDPGDSAAREYLRRATEGALALERRTVAEEREALLAGSVKARREQDALEAARKRRTSSWEKLFSKTRSLASGTDTVREAVLEYERLLAGTPVYLDNRARFLSMTAEIKETFYKTISARYPYLVEGRTFVDERDLATLFFSQESAEDVSARYVQTGQTQGILDKSDRLRRLEREILRHYVDMAKGRDLFIRERYEGAVAAFRYVLAFDPGNEEALFYKARAERELEQAALPVRSKQKQNKR